MIEHRRNGVTDVAKQTVTLRLDDDDLTYLSRVEISGAGNLSEKIRALIAEARAQREGTEDFTAAHDFARRLFARVEREINAAEVDSSTRSELIHRLMAWLPEITAYTLSACQNKGGSDDCSARLKDVEQGMAERVFSLVDSMLQLAGSDFSGCHAPEKLASRARFAVKSTSEGR
jgi:hypothetical protein